MSLVGKYFCNELKATLTIDAAKDSDGSGNGSFSMNSITIPVKIHYHFYYDPKPTTNYTFWGAKYDPNKFVGMAGFSKTEQADNGIYISGGLSIHNDVFSFSGFFKRV